MIEGVPPALVPVVIAVVASIVGALLWRLFKLALKIVFVVVVVIIVGGIVVHRHPALIGMATDALAETTSPAQPTTKPSTKPIPGAPRAP